MLIWILVLNAFTLVLLWFLPGQISKMFQEQCEVHRQQLSAVVGKICDIEDEVKKAKALLEKSP